MDVGSGSLRLDNQFVGADEVAQNGVFYFLVEEGIDTTSKRTRRSVCFSLSSPCSCVLFHSILGLFLCIILI